MPPIHELAERVREALPPLEGHEQNCPCSVGRLHAALDAILAAYEWSEKAHLEANRRAIAERATENGDMLLSSCARKLEAAEQRIEELEAALQEIASGPSDVSPPEIARCAIGWPAHGWADDPYARAERAEAERDGVELALDEANVPRADGVDEILYSQQHRARLLRERAERAERELAEARSEVERLLPFEGEAISKSIKLAEAREALRQLENATRILDVMLREPAAEGLMTAEDYRSYMQGAWLCVEEAQERARAALTEQEGGGV